MIRLGIVGCGWVTESVHLPVLQRLPGIKVRAACDTRDERLQHMRRVFGVSRLYRNWQELVTSGIFSDQMLPDFTFLVLGDAGKAIINLTRPTGVLLYRKAFARDRLLKLSSSQIPNDLLERLLLSALNSGDSFFSLNFATENVEED